MPSRRFLSRAFTALFVCIVFAGQSFGQGDDYPEWRDAFAIYINDPEQGGGLVIDLAKSGTDGLPPAALTVLGDAHLRRGNFGRARKMFLRVLDDPTSETLMGPGKASIAAHAQMGLGMAAVGAGKMSDAREWFATASEAPGDMGYMATLGHAQAAIALGRYDEALSILEALSEAPGVESAVLDMARFTTANALLAEGDSEAAAESFGEIASDSSGSLAADAAYARALAESRTAGSEGPTEQLTELVASCPPIEEEEEVRKVSRAERQLDPGAVLQAWVRNYREKAFSEFQAQPSTLLALGGCDLARETIAVWEAEPVVVAQEARAPVELSQRVDVPAAAEEPPAQVKPEGETAPAPVPANASTPENADPSSSGLTWVLVVGALIVIAILFVVRRRG